MKRKKYRKLLLIIIELQIFSSFRSGDSTYLKEKKIASLVDFLSRNNLKGILKCEALPQNHFSDLNKPDICTLQSKREQ